MKDVVPLAGTVGMILMRLSKGVIPPASTVNTTISKNVISAVDMGLPAYPADLLLRKTSRKIFWLGNSIECALKEIMYILAMDVSLAEMVLAISQPMTCMTIIPGTIHVTLNVELDGPQPVTHIHLLIVFVAHHHRLSLASTQPIILKMVIPGTLPVASGVEVEGLRSVNHI